MQVVPVNPASFWKPKPTVQAEHTRAPLTGRLEVKKPGEQVSWGLQAVWPARSWKVLLGQLLQMVLLVGVAAVEMKVPAPQEVALKHEGRVLAVGVKDWAGQGEQRRSELLVGLVSEKLPAGQVRTVMQVEAPVTFWKVPVGQGVMVQAVHEEPSGHAAWVVGEVR